MFKSLMMRGCVKRCNIRKTLIDPATPQDDESTKRTIQTGEKGVVLIDIQIVLGGLFSIPI